MKKIDPTIMKETSYIGTVAFLFNIVMQSVFLIIGKWDYTVLLGGMLGFIEENKRVERLSSGKIINTYPDGSVALIPENSTVSMNCFGFTPSVIEYMEPIFEEFLERNKDDLSTCELLIPTTVEILIDSGKCDVRVIPTESAWKGVTYIEDSLPFREFIRRQKAAGNYPADLWAKEEICV